MGIKGMHDWKTWDDVCAFQKIYEVLHRKSVSKHTDNVHFAIIACVWPSPPNMLEKTCECLQDPGVTCASKHPNSRSDSVTTFTVVSFIHYPTLTN